MCIVFFQSPKNVHCIVKFLLSLTAGPPITEASVETTVTNWWVLSNYSGYIYTKNSTILCTYAVYHNIYVCTFCTIIALSTYTYDLEASDKSTGLLWEDFIYLFTKANFTAIGHNDAIKADARANVYYYTERSRCDV